MKKVISLVMLISLVLSYFTLTAFAENTDDKIAKELSSLAGEGGSVLKLRHSFESAEEFYAAIGELTYYEAHSFDPDEIIVGLPYDSLPKIAALDKVKSIEPLKCLISNDMKPENKYSKALTSKLSELDYNAIIHIAVIPAYCGYVYYGFTQDDFSNIDEYLERKRSTAKEFFVSKNQKCLDCIKETVNIADVKLSYYTPGIWMTVEVRDIQKIAALDEILEIDYISSVPNPTPTSNTGIYHDNFVEWIRLSEYDPEINPQKYGTFSDYKEMYYHNSVQGEAPDWVLIRTHVEFFNLTSEMLCRRVGNRVLVSWRSGATYPFGLFIYDAQTDTFTEIKGESPFGQKENNLDKYKGLTEAIESLELGYKIGDADMNGEIDIVDATVIQRLLIGILSDRMTAYLEPMKVISDIDGDGLDITDATRVQRYLVHKGDLY